MKEMTVTCRSHPKFTTEDWQEFEHWCKEGSLYIEHTLSRFFESGRALMKRLPVGPPVKRRAVYNLLNLNHVPIRINYESKPVIMIRFADSHD